MLEYGIAAEIIANIYDRLLFLVEAFQLFGKKVSSHQSRGHITVNALDKFSFPRARSTALCEARQEIAAAGSLSRRKAIRLLYFRRETRTYLSSF